MILRSKIDTYFIANPKYRIIFENLILLAFFLCVGATFETNDDIGLRIVVSGVYGTPSPYMRVSSTILGLILSSLYALTSAINWYAVYVLTVVFVSLCALTFVLEGILEGITLTCVKWPFLIISGYELYCSAQFTKTAGIASISGWALFLYCTNQVVCSNGFGINKNGKEKISTLVKAVIPSVLLISTGAMVRIDAMKLTSAYFLLVLVCYCIFEFAKKNVGIIKCYLLGLCCVFASIFLIICVDKLSFDLNEGQKQYKEWYEAVLNCVDYDLPEYWEATDYYEQLGLNDSDFYMLRGWYFGDTDFFTVELLNNIRKAKREDISPVDRIKNILIDFPDTLRGRTKERLFLLFLYTVLLYILLSKKTIFSNVLVTGISLSTLLALVYFLYLGRMMPRVNSIVWLSASISTLFVMGVVGAKEEVFPAKDGLIMFSKVLAILVLILSLPIYVEHGEQIRESKSYTDELKELSLYVAEDKNTLYVNDANNLIENAWGGFYDVLPAGVKFDNVVDSNGWLCAMPYWYDNMHSHGINNIYRDSMDKEVIFMSNENRMPSIIRFINEHYQPNAKYEKVMEFVHQPTFYRIVSKTNNKALEIEGHSIKCDDGNLVSEINVENYDDRVSVSGKAYKMNKDSYYQNVYVVIRDRKTNEYQSFGTTKKESNETNDAFNGKYGDFYFEINQNDIMYENYDLEVYLKCDEELYFTSIK